MKKNVEKERESVIQLSLERAHLATAHARTERDVARIRLAAREGELAEPRIECTCENSPILGYAKQDVPCPAHLADAELAMRGTRDRLLESLKTRDDTIGKLLEALKTRDDRIGKLARINKELGSRLAKAERGRERDAQ